MSDGEDGAQWDEWWQREMTALRITKDRAEEEMARLRFDLGEAEAEIGRHHRDLNRISRILDELKEVKMLDPLSMERVQKGLDMIRGIVG